jgi:hypothetical protein
LTKKLQLQGQQRFNSKVAAAEAAALSLNYSSTISQNIDL